MPILRTAPSPTPIFSNASLTQVDSGNHCAQSQYLSTLEDALRTALADIYDHSATGRRLINHAIQRIDDSEDEPPKCQISVGRRYDYQAADEGPATLTLPIDAKGFPLDAQEAVSQQHMPAHQALARFLMQPILQGAALELDPPTANQLSNIVAKEQNCHAMALPLFESANIGPEDESVLFDLDEPDGLCDAGQVVHVGAKLRAMQPEQATGQLAPPSGEHPIKAGLLNTLLLTRQLMPHSVPAITSSPPADEHRMARALPEAHPAPRNTDIWLDIFSMGISKLVEPLQGMNDYGLQRYQLFLQRGTFSDENDKAVVTDYLCQLVSNMMSQNYYRSYRAAGTLQTFLNNRAYLQLSILQNLVRDLLVHPPQREDTHHLDEVIKKYLDFPLVLRGRVKTATQEYNDRVAEGRASLYNDQFFLDVMSYLRAATPESRMRRLTAGAQRRYLRHAQAIWRIWLNNPTIRPYLVSVKGLQNRFRLGEHIINLLMEKGYSKITALDHKAIADSAFPNGRLARELWLAPGTQQAILRPHLLRYAVQTQLQWAEKNFHSDAELSRVVKQCNIGGILSQINPSAKDIVMGLLRQVEQVRDDALLTDEAKHARQKQALDKFRNDMSRFDGGKKFLYGFNTYVQEGPLGAVALGMDLTDLNYGRRESSLSPEARAGIKEPLPIGNTYPVVERINNRNFIYHAGSKNILHMEPTRNPNVHIGRNLVGKPKGIFESVGPNAYRAQDTLFPLDPKEPNRVDINGQPHLMVKESNFDAYRASNILTGKSATGLYLRAEHGMFYRADGLRGGGVIHHVDRAYSELREGDPGFDEDLLDIDDDGPLLETTLPQLSESLMPTPEQTVKGLVSAAGKGDVAAQEAEVVLLRGTTGAKASHLLEFRTAGGEPAQEPGLIQGGVSKIRLQIKKLQIKHGGMHPEFTTDPAVADGFSRDHHLVVVKVKAKYLMRGSQDESGWLLAPTTPVEPLAVIDRTYGKPEVTENWNASK